LGETGVNPERNLGGETAKSLLAARTNFSTFSGFVEKEKWFARTKK
jgi:hypothetical protein